MRSQVAAFVLISLLAAGTMALLGGCLSSRQAQNLSDGVAGVEAARARPQDPIAATALAGAVDHLNAVAEGQPLPMPRRTASAITVDPAGYRRDAAAAAREADSSLPVLGMVAGGITAVLGIARFLPIGGPIANCAWTLLASRQERERDNACRADADYLRVLLGCIRGLPATATMADLRQRMEEIGPQMLEMAASQDRIGPLRTSIASN